MTGPVLHRAAAFLERKSAAADAGFRCTLATMTPVARNGEWEVLDCSAEGCDLSRGDLSLIIGHDQSALAVGIVSGIRAQGGKVVGEARFSSSPEAQQLRADVEAGIHRYLSVGYHQLDKGVANSEGHVVYRWQPVEVSIVSVPADPNAGFFRSLPQGAVTRTDPMTTTTTAPAQGEDTRTPAEQITELCARHGQEALGRALITRGATVAQAKDEILETLGRNDRATGGHFSTRQMTPSAETEKDLIINTLASRMGVRGTGPTIRSVSCVGLAVRSLQMSGARVQDSWSPTTILERAFHTTSDFPALINGAANRVLIHAYEQAPVALKAFARRVDMPDFRARQTVRLGGAPSLEKVNEHGEFHYGTVVEGSSTWKLATYGRIIALTRQAMVNDDLSGFSELLTKFGQSAARREAEELTNMLVTPPDIDGKPLFSADRNTQIANGLSIDGLGAATLALRLQKDLDGALIGQEPAALIVPATLEMKALQLVATFNATQASDVQPFRLKVVVEPRLQSNAWYLVASNQSALEYGYLDGNEGVSIIQREGFEVDGLEIKARLDFGCGWASPVGWVKSTNTGAP